MSSLQEQMLKSGLVSKDKAKRIQKDKQKKVKVERKVERKTKQPPAPKPLTDADRRRAEQIERDRQLNLKRERKAAKKALAAEIKQLVEQNRIDRSKAETPYSFVHNKKIKKIYVTEVIRLALSNGQMAIICRNSKNQELFDVVPREAAQKIAEKRPDLVVQIEKDKSDKPDESDPYADFQVPDDLMW